MPRDIRLSTDHWELLGDMHPHHKLLYTLMYLKADHAGVVTHALKEFSGLAGYSYSQSDVDALGDRVKRLDDRRILVTDYLRKQYKTLSRKSHGQNNLWAAMATHWGKPTADGKEPFELAWHTMGIGHKVPEFADHYSGVGPKPEWKVKNEREVERAASVPIPSWWPATLVIDFHKWMDKRAEALLRQTSKGESQHFLWDLGMAMSAVEKINQWLELGVHHSKISDSIAAAYQGSYPSFRMPKLTNEQLRRTDQEDQ